MERGCWENSVSINPPESPFDVKYILNYLREFEAGGGAEQASAVMEALRLDTRAVPISSDREGYHGSDHLNYWLSGFTDMARFVEIKNKYVGLKSGAQTHLDFGCASGRFVRHFLYKNNPALKVYGCDINARHISFNNTYLNSASTTYFQNTSMPHLPLGDNSIDSLTAYSVFSHIDLLDTSWIMEFHRILKVGGLAVLTFHPLELLDPSNCDLPFYDNVKSHPEYDLEMSRYRSSERGKFTFRWRGSSSYTANVFLSEDYINKMWGGILRIVEFQKHAHAYQSICVMEKQ
jgi:ubiquinone/menaquinone biosynthesis C-methylase UbiE